AATSRSTPKLAFGHMQLNAAIISGASPYAHKKSLNRVAQAVGDLSNKSRKEFCVTRCCARRACGAHLRPSFAPWEFRQSLSAPDCRFRAGLEKLSRCRKPPSPVHSESSA